MTSLFHRDAAYAVRLLTRRPGFAIIALATLAIGIGLNTAVFSLVRAVLLRPLPIPGSQRLVQLFDVSPPPARDLDDVSSANFIDWADQTRTLDGLALVGGRTFTLTDSGDPEQILAMTVSPQFFQVLEARPALGRLFLGGDYAPFAAEYAKAPREQRGVHPTVVILGYDLWQRRFGGRADVVGSTVRLDGRSVDVIGVLPKAFAFTDVPGWNRADCWLPEAPNPLQRRARMYSAIGRLAPGVSLSRAQAEFDLVGSRLANRYPDADKDRGVRLTPLLESETAGVRARLWVLFGAALCVLLIACANVANLLLAHASGRRLELATRLALGATRGQLVRQTLTESVMISLAGGAMGLLLAWWAVPALVAMAPPETPRLLEIGVDRWMFAFAAIMSLAVGIGCGLAVVVSMDRVNPHAGGLRPSGADTGHHGRRVRQTFTVAEIALALMLVVGAGLLVRTLRALDAQELGFDPRNVISIGLSPDWQKYGGRAAVAQFESALVTRLSSAPGVTAIGVGSRPLGLGSASTLFRAADAQESHRMAVDDVSPGYLEALGARLLEGRFVGRGDTAAAPRVALVNSTAARILFGGSEPVGQSIVMDDARLSVVGVVSDVRRGNLELPPGPCVYLSHLQPSSITVNNLLIRTAGDPRSVLPQVRAVMRQLDPDQALTRVGTLQERIDEVLAPRRFMLRLIGLFSALALALAVLGVYGVVAESVAQRVPEIGIRVALGATPGAIRRLVVGQGLWMLLLGLAAGVMGAVLLRQTMASLVFGVRTTDPIVYAAACGALAAAAIAACAIPASRAARLDPVAALRQE